MSDLDYSNLSDQNEELKARISELKSERDLEKGKVQDLGKLVDDLRTELAKILTMAVVQSEDFKKLEASRDKWKGVAEKMAETLHYVIESGESYERVQEVSGHALAAYDAALSAEAKEGYNS